ncbi:UbiH/UbiF/VisC/COQ6 family ubiquinone biosynthesis hydroxylase [Roseomonas sp. NAR14]|uniref:UbiH/UbiF/VisC/COQ6 family ubiquinone biosynthesis hydroxylase n=1 Tax=Roseomonas acroporae TaxID=2937791 RepID=A0A9X1Y671_9PROT|nr:UbiH/UbiF/VisC/COQ6 family ubiquinone biosynthesis hydroxylase [Roseomonas acroporae]MCK8784719.1 UbiH/UbiF/VisC/COQ6 family ubiquinone biosynthesis hydroxylase [Roseomonas acroporae]
MQAIPASADCVGTALPDRAAARPGGGAAAIEVAVCVVGAGPVGASLAATLAAAGVPTAVVDSQPLPPMELPAFDGRAYAIALASKRLLEAAGIWACLPNTPCPILGIHVADGRPGEAPSPLALTFAHEELGEEPFGWMVEARALRVALNARLAALPALRVLAPAEARAERRPEGATLRLADGTVIHARLVVAAEGRQSPLRRQAGIPAARLDYHRIALVGAFAHERPHGNVALEQFLPNGPFAQLPLADPPAEVVRAQGGVPGGMPEGLVHASALVWSEPRALAERFLRLPDAEYARELDRRVGGRLGRVWPIGRRWSYPLAALHAARYTATRLALVGDAAHGIHPIAGQGLNLGFRDVAVLAELVIEAHNAGADVGEAALLARYQARRRPDSLVMLGATHALERLFGNDLGPVRLARDLGIAAVNRIPPLKRFFARQAMGLGPNPPGLLAGRGLLPG